MPHFDSSISLGTLVATATVLFTLYRFHIANVKRFMEIEFRVNQMWNSFKKRFSMDDLGDDRWPPQ